MIYFSGIIELIASINPCPEQHISIILILNTSFFSSFHFRLKLYAVWFIQEGLNGGIHLSVVG